jgi:hypothetical protein
MKALSTRYEVATSPYNHDLRAVGQALEAQGISTFELKAQGGHYVVSGTPEKPPTLIGALRHWRRRPLVLTYSAQDIVILEKKGQGRRTATGRLPDFYNVSNVLRTVGAYLDGKNARLLEIQIRPLTLTLMYQATGGHPLVEDRTIASFYKIFTEMHGRRSGPTTLQP